MTFKYVMDWDIDSIINKKSTIANGINYQNYLKFRNFHDTIFWENFPDRIISSDDNIVSYDSLLSTDKYIYKIPVFRHNLYFLRKFSENGINIPDYIRKDIINGRSILLIDYNNEPLLGLGKIYYSEEFNNIIKNVNLPKERIVTVHANYNESFHFNDIYNYEPIDLFPIWVNYRSDKLISYEPKKLYVNYNRRLRMHKVLLVANLVKNKLFDDGIISLGSDNLDVINNLNMYDHTLSESDIVSVKNYISNSPDNLFSSDINPVNDINIEHHRTSFLSLVNETMANPNINFISEKTYKPIALGHPFIINGSPYLIKRLRENGFKTFNDFWDESYDNKLNISDRVNSIIKILKDLKKMSDNQRIEMRNSMHNILVHNQSLFNQSVKNIINDNPINSIIKKYLK